MATYTALTTLQDAQAATDLSESLERLDPAPTGVGIFEVEDGSGHWEVGGYFVARPDGIALALLAAAHGAADFAVSRVDDRDWVAQVRRELHPVHAGRFTVHGNHDSHRVGDHRIGLKIEAAMAFGTGHHGTTRGCLMLFDRMLKRGFRPRRVADIGSGTGVLAMAASQALRVPSLATDVDPLAAATARANVIANRLTPWIRTGVASGLLGSAFSGQRFDLIFANILAAPIKRLAPSMARHLSGSGCVILSGLLTAQARSVASLYAGHGLYPVDRLTIGDWTSLVMASRRRGM